MDNRRYADTVRKFYRCFTSRTPLAYNIIFAEERTLWAGVEKVRFPGKNIISFSSPAWELKRKEILRTSDNGRAPSMKGRWGHGG